MCVSAMKYVLEYKAMISCCKTLSEKRKIFCHGEFKAQLKFYLVLYITFEISGERFKSKKCNTENYTNTKNFG